MDGRQYYPFISYRIEGETDLTDSGLLLGESNEDINGGVVLGLNVSTNRSLISITAPPLPHYRQATDMPAFTPTTGSPTITVKAAAESGTTYEILIDQITFIPNLDAVVGELADPTLSTTIVDGADAGDDNGKFTWTPYPGEQTHAGPGDFQQKSGASTAEWFERVVPDDAIQFIDFASQVSANVYGLHGAGYRGERTWAEDTFDNRTTSSTAGSKNLGVDPYGFGYSEDGVASSTVYCDGAGNGVLQVNVGTGFAEAVWGAPPSVGNNQSRRFLLYDQWSWSGTCTFTDDAGMGALNIVRLDFLPMQIAGGATVDAGFIRVTLQAQAWQAVFPDGGVSSIHSIPWFTQGAQLGWRIEVERYVVRYKIWDASGAEPGSFNDEVFVAIDGVTGGFDRAYDYDDFVKRSSRITEPFDGLRVQLNVVDNIPAMTFPLQINLNSMKLEHDPGGDPGDVGVRFESPEGDSWGDITIPYGAMYFVSWGSGAITEQDGFGDWWLSYSSKVWNEPGVAEVQRAETVGWWFFLSTFEVMSMNWSSAKNFDIRRVHG